MSLTTPPDASRASSTRSPSCGKPGCGRRGAVQAWRRLQAWGRRLQDRLGCRVLLGVLAEHAEQAAHLGQPGPGGVADRGEPLCARGGQPRRGQPAGLCLHRDHRDVVRDHVVQLAGDPGPLPARQVIGQHPLGFLAGGAVALALLARSPRHRGHRRERDRRRQQDREHPGLGGRRGQAGHGRHPHAPRGGTGQHQGEPEERCPQQRRRGPVTRLAPAGTRPPAAPPPPRSSPARTAPATAPPPGTPSPPRGPGGAVPPARWPAGRTRTSAARSARSPRHGRPVRPARRARLSWR